MQNWYLGGLVENWSTAGSMIVCRYDREEESLTAEREWDSVCDLGEDSSETLR